MIFRYRARSVFSRFYDHKSRVRRQRNTFKTRGPSRKAPEGSPPPRRFLSDANAGRLLMTTQMPWAQNRRPRYFSSPPLLFSFPFSLFVEILLLAPSFGFFSSLLPPVRGNGSRGRGRHSNANADRITWRRGDVRRFFLYLREGDEEEGEGRVIRRAFRGHTEMRLLFGKLSGKIEVSRVV